MQFRPSEHGFPFPNWWPPGSPVIEVPTPFGTIPIGDAHGGVCGGMVFAAADYFHAGRPIPQSQDRLTFKYLCRRLLDSWHLPFGALKYYDWQRRPTAGLSLSAVQLIDGTAALTLNLEWPKLRQLLDAGKLAPLGLVKPFSLNPLLLGKNHQVLAFGYEIDGSTVHLHVYDPNYPSSNDTRLSFEASGNEAEFAIRHTHDPGLIRGFFVTEYDPVEP